MTLYAVPEKPNDKTDSEIVEAAQRALREVQRTSIPDHAKRAAGATERALSHYAAGEAV